MACTLDPDLHLMLMTHSEVKGSFTTLQDCSPAYVVLFDPDVSIIRAIETYQSALPPSLPSVRVYFVMYGKCPTLLPLNGLHQLISPIPLQREAARSTGMQAHW